MVGGFDPIRAVAAGTEQIAQPCLITKSLYSEHMATVAKSRPPSRLLESAHVNFTDNGRRAHYGAAYMRVLCAHAGASFTESSMDEDIMAIDGAVDFARMPVRVQIKCTSRFIVLGGKFTWPLEPG